MLIATGQKSDKISLKEVLEWAAHLEHLQTVLKEFNLTDAPNKTTLIRYFREGLHPFIWAQLNYQRQDLDSWEEVVEKTRDAEAKTNLQPRRVLHLQTEKSLCKQVSWQAKKLVAVSATSMSMTDKKTEEEALEWPPSIWYLPVVRDRYYLPDITCPQAVGTTCPQAADTTCPGKR